MAMMTFSTNGGDKHVRNNDLVEGRFDAEDLRLRFEFGNVDVNDLGLPAKVNDAFQFSIQGLSFTVKLFRSEFGAYKGYWEKGSNGSVSWIDYVIYAGEKTKFDLSNMNRAVLGFAFSMDNQPDFDALSFSVKNGVLSAEWENLELSVPEKPREKENKL
jgi:hypothetical protein